MNTFVRQVKNREDGVKLMGFGHRVYKNYDPRAAIVKQAAHEVLETLGVNDPLLDIALRLEEVALADDYFISRKLYPNVDFYTGLIYKAMGFPTRMFTVLFALGRLPGLDRPVARDDRGPGDQDRPAAPGLHRRPRARLPRPRRPLSLPALSLLAAARRHRRSGRCAAASAASRGRPGGPPASGAPRPGADAVLLAAAALLLATASARR